MKEKGNWVKKIFKLIYIVWPILQQDWQKLNIIIWQEEEIYQEKESLKRIKLKPI